MGKSERPKPCPFCGNANVEIVMYSGGKDLSCFIDCNCPGMSFGPFSTEESLVKAWNTRADHVERLAKAWSETCSVCGCPVEVVGRTTKSYKRLNPEADKLAEALADILRAIKFRQPKDYAKTSITTTNESNMCYPARVPIAFVINSEQALAEYEGGLNE